MDKYLPVIQNLITFGIVAFAAMKGWKELLAYLLERDKEKSVGKTAIEAQNKKIKELEDRQDAQRKEIMKMEDNYRDMVREALDILKNH